MDLKGKKVYFPVESLTGLGHLNRTGKMVRDMTKAGLDVTVASGSFVDPERFFAGAECRALAPIVFNNNGQHYTLNANGTRTILPAFNEAARKDERTRAQLKYFDEAKPDVLITEFWPFNRAVADQEMNALLQRSEGLLRVVSVRDVLDPPKEGFEAEHEAREKWAVDVINKNFDALLVHGDPGFIPLNETFSRLDEIKVPVIYTGYVVDQPKGQPLPRGPEAPVVVSVGAGNDCHELMFAFLTAWEKLQKQADKDPAAASLVNRPVHLICGPRFRDEAYPEVQAWAENLSQRGYPIHVERYREDFTTLLAGAAFSVSCAGYNTTLETLASDTPALLIPNYAYYGGNMKINTEQLYRLRRLEQAGMAAYAHPDDVQNPKKFSAILLSEFTRQSAGDKPHPKLNFNGAENTIAAIAELISKKAAALDPASATAPRRAAAQGAPLYAAQT